MGKWMNTVMHDGWVHPLAKPLPSLANNLQWNIVMDDWELDEKSLGKLQQLQHCNFLVPQEIYKGLTNNVGSKFSVGDTTPWFTVSIDRDN